MNITKLGRIGALTGVALLLASQLLVAAVSAGSNTRYVWVGSTYDGTAAGEGGNCDTAIADPARVGSLDLSPVTAGAQTHFKLWVVNCGTQNLSNLTLTVGKYPGADDILSSPFSAGDGVTVSEIFGVVPSDLACNSANLPARLLTCSLQALRPGASNAVQLDVILSTTSSAKEVPVWAAAKVAENTNDNGTNQDTFEAGTLDATGLPTPLTYSGSCDDVYSYLSPSNPTAGTCAIGATSEQTQITFNKIGDVRVQDSSTGPNQSSCPDAAGLDPIGTKYSDATIAGETTYDDVTWTISIDLKATNQNGTNPAQIVICHWDTAGDFVGSTTTTNLCSAYPPASPDEVDPMCTVSSNVVNNQGHKILTVVFRTPGNGSGRMF